MYFFKFFTIVICLQTALYAQQQLPTGITLSQNAFDTLVIQICQKTLQSSYEYTAEDALNFVRISNTLGVASFKRKLKKMSSQKDILFRKRYDTVLKKVKDLLMIQNGYSPKYDIYYNPKYVKPYTNSYFSPIE